MTKITEELIAAIAQAVRRDMPNIEACALFRIGESTFYTWKTAGEKDIEAGIDSLYACFVKAIKAAESEAIEESLAMIRSASKEGKNWQARAWILERCYRKRFAQNADQFEKIEKQISELALRIERRNGKSVGAKVNDSQMDCQSNKEKRSATKTTGRPQRKKNTKS
jgi:hypothetical protein